MTRKEVDKMLAGHRQNMLRLKAQGFIITVYKCSADLMILEAYRKSDCAKVSIRM